MRKTALTILTIFGVVLPLYLPSSVSAGNYGRSNYSTCVYSADCPQQQTQTSSPIPMTPPKAPEDTTTEATAEIRISFVTPTDGDSISNTKTTVSIRVEKINTTTNEQLALTDIGWVALYANDHLVASDYNISASGSASFTWNVLDIPGTRLTAVVFDKNGTALVRTEVKITYDPTLEASIQEAVGTSATSSNAGGQQRPIRRGGFLSKTLGDTGSLGELGKIAKPIDLPPAAEATIVSFPFWLFFMLICIAVRLLWQAYREVLATRRIRRQILLEKEVDEQKVTFISLVSHYLNTPYALISSATDMFTSVDRVATQSIDTLRSATKNLQASIFGLIDKARAQSNLSAVAVADSGEASYVSAPVYRSPSFLIPIIGVAVIVAITNLLLQVATTVSLNGIGLLAQATIFTAIAVFLLLTIRNRRLHEYEKQLASGVLQEQRALDATRNSFIHETASQLRTGVSAVLSAAAPVKQTSSYKYLNRGVLQFQSYIDKFELAHQVEEKSVDPSAASVIHLQQLVSETIAKYPDIITQKQLTSQNNAADISVEQNALLFGFVLDSIIHNALKFNRNGGMVAVDTDDQGDHVLLTVTDNGIGIPASKLAKIFDPFNRATSVTQFDYEGMGFSLYLSHLIMRRLGGNIRIDSHEGSGTSVTIVVPRIALG